MESETVSTFEASLQGSATAERFEAAGFQSTLEDHLEPPAVGVSLPFEGVSLDGVDVETDFSPSDLRAARTGVTPAGMGIADYGTVTVQSREDGDELVSLYPERHVVVVAASDVVADMPDAFEQFDREFAAGTTTQVMATGPSSTADMGTLIEGVHGPKEVHVLILEDR